MQGHEHMEEVSAGLNPDVQGIRSKIFWNELEGAWLSMIYDVDHFLDSIFAGSNYRIDEVALAYATEDDLYASAVHDMIPEDGVEMFNQTKDRVRTFPFDTFYTVEYLFFQKKGMPFRIEAMNIRNGHSPLHYGHLGGSRRRTVHASFKLKSEQEYKEVIKDLSDQRGVHLAQSCMSDYGAFSYWRVEEIWNKYEIYLKPRVNLRDDQPEQSPVQF